MLQLGAHEEEQAAGGVSGHQASAAAAACGGVCCCSTQLQWLRQADQQWQQQRTAAQGAAHSSTTPASSAAAQVRISGSGAGGSPLQHSGSGIPRSALKHSSNGAARRSGAAERHWCHSQCGEAQHRRGGQQQWPADQEWHRSRPVRPGCRASPTRIVCCSLANGPGSERRRTRLQWGPAACRSGACVWFDSVTSWLNCYRRGRLAPSGREDQQQPGACCCGHTSLAFKARLGRVVGPDGRCASACCVACVEYLDQPGGSREEFLRTPRVVDVCQEGMSTVLKTAYDRNEIRATCYCL